MKEGSSNTARWWRSATRSSPSTRPGSGPAASAARRLLGVASCLRTMRVKRSLQKGQELSIRAQVEMQG
jgi:hypothetical protein